MKCEEEKSGSPWYSELFFTPCPKGLSGVGGPTNYLVTPNSIWIEVELGCDKIQSKINEFSYSQDNKLSYSEFCVMMNKRRTSEKDAEQAEDRRGSRGGGGQAASDSSKKYQVD